MRRKRTITISCWLLAAISQLAAQTTLNDTLREVTVTETRHSHALKSTAPMHVLDRHDMLTQGVVDMTDALHRLPGITLRDYGGAGGMKTVSVRGFGAKHTGVSYDGVMLSECQSGEIDLSRYSLDNVDHLSLVVGDNSDIFIPARQASTPAVLHIETLRMPSEDRKPHLATQLKMGSFGYVSPFVRYEQNLSNKLSLSVVGEYTYAENDYPYTLRNVTIVTEERRNNSRMNSGHGEMSFLWDINKKNRMSGKLYYYDNDRQLPGQVRYYTNESNETLRDRNAFGQLQYQTRNNSGWALKISTKYNWAASIYKNGAYFGSTSESDYWQHEAMGTAQLLYTPNNHWAFNYSVDYAYNSLNSNTGQIIHPWRYTLLQSATTKYHNGRLTMLARLLHSLYLNDAKEGKSAHNIRRLSPSLSFSYKFFTEQDLYGRVSYKNIFRSPTFNESYYFHYGSANLLPETTDQMNVGLTWHTNLMQHLSFKMTADGYYNHVRDMIVSVPHNMFVWTCINVGKVEVYGLDATASATLTLAPRHELTASGNYTYQQVENRSNPESPNYRKQIAYYPEHVGSVSFSYENPWLNTSLHGTFVSNRWATNEHLEGTLVKGYQDFGLTCWRHWQWNRHLFEVRADIRNIFNQQYEIVSHYPMPRRSYQFSIKYHF